jgi:hypothetical protein
MTNNTMCPLDGCMENRLEISMKFSLVAIRPKVDALKTRAKLAFTII